MGQDPRTSLAETVFVVGRGISDTTYERERSHDLARDMKAQSEMGRGESASGQSGTSVAVWLSSTLIVILAVSCTSVGVGPEASKTPYACAATPSSEMRGVDGTSLVGVRGGDIFLFTTRAGPFYASPGEKFPILLANPPPDPRAVSLDVHGRNLATGSTLDVRAKDLTASWGEAWGAIYRFPDAGCWELAVDQAGNRGTVVIEVVATCPEERRSFCPEATSSP